MEPAGQPTHAGFSTTCALRRYVAQLTGNTGGNDNDVSILEGGLGTIVGGKEASDLGVGGDVRKIGSNTGSVDNIVEGELVNEGAKLKKKGEGLKVNPSKHPIYVGNIKACSAIFF